MYLRFYTLLTVVIYCGSNIKAQMPSVASGKIIRHENFKSAFVTSRHVDVWLPEGYAKDTAAYAVLYMHDGQMLFDSSHTWNHQEWGMDETGSELIRDKKVKPFIIVGIWNGGDTRHADYFPQKPFESLSDSAKASVYKAVRQNGADIFKGNRIASDGYLKFIVSELKPFIDKTYRTRTGSGGTFIAGSSMGGLISLYALCEYPKIFGGAACISTHWPGIFQLENNPIPDAFFSYLQKKIPDPVTHKIYFDHGTATLDALYPGFQKKADVLFLKKGYNKGNFLSKIFEGANHSEDAWKKRMSIPLEFLLQ